MCFASFLEFLEIDKVAIAFAGFKQGLVLAEGEELSVLKECDLIHVFHGGDSMCDEDGRFALTSLPETREDRFLRLGINGGNGVVENKDGRVLHERSGNGDALLLTARDGYTAFTEDGAIALMEADDIIVDIRKLCGVFYGFVMVCTVIFHGGECNIVFDGIAEKEIILGDISCIFAYGADGDGIDILAIDEDRTVGDIVCTENEVDERRFAATCFSDDTNIVSGFDAEGNIGENVIIACRITEGEIFEFDRTIDLFHVRNVCTVSYVFLGIEECADASQRCFAARAHIDQLGDRHDGPYDRCEITDEFHELSRVEDALLDKIAAVAQNDADHGFDKKGNGDMEKRGYLGVGNVRVFVFSVEDTEREKLLELFDERFDNGNAREAFLCEIRKLREGFLSCFPFHHHIFADKRADDEQKCHRDECEKRKDAVHAPHFEDGESAEKQSVAEHHDARAKAFLNGLEIVCEQGHKVADLIDTVIFLRKLSGMSEHFVSDRGLDADTRTKKANTPQKSAECHQHDDKNHRKTNFIEKQVPVEGSCYTVKGNGTVIHAVYDEIVKLGNFELQNIHEQEREKPQEQYGQIFQIISVDMFSENHVVWNPPCILNFLRNIPLACCVER